MKSIEECLDIILNELVINWDKPNNERVNLKSKDILSRLGLPDTMQKDEFFKRLIFRLIKDGYAELNTDIKVDRNSHLKQFENYPLITIEGYYFITKMNGYTGEYNTTVTAETIKNNREKRLLRWTAAVAIGAIGLVVWELIKFYYYEGHGLCH